MNEKGFLTELDRVNHFLTLLRTEPNDELFSRCLEQLDGYVNAQLDGEPYLEQFSELAVLLDAHPDCVEAYALLHDLITADRTHTLAAPDHTPAPDLSFLRAKAPSLLAQLSAALQQTADTITLTLSEALISALRPLPSPSLALRTAQSERYGEKLLQLDSAHAPTLHIPFTLVAYQDSQEPASSLVEVTVQPPGKSWPELSGYHVSLGYADQSHQATTDAWGVVSFANIPVSYLPQLVIGVNLVV